MHHPAPAERMTQMKFLCKKIWLPRLAFCTAALILSLCGTVRYYAASLPDHFYAESGRDVSVQTLLPVTVRRITDTAPPMQSAELRLFGMIPVKTASLTTFGPVSVYVGGQPFGIRMLMDGVMIVSLSGIAGADGSVCPAADAGLEIGDIILQVNGRPVSSNADLQNAVSESDGSAVRVTYRRGEQLHTAEIRPLYVPLSQRWQTGMWVRDSTAGIGTVTYFTHAANGMIAFAGLGHAVCDIDTGEQIPLGSGDVIAVSVNDIITGSAGKPGELRGKFNTAGRIGTLQANTDCGVFGLLDRLPQSQMLVPLGYRQDVTRGEALIYTTIDGTVPQAFTAEIEEIRSDDHSQRDLVIHVTDPALLRYAGGIVQGMSGSPILQNGRLVGAVTHVFVKDPTRGYGIFAENMFAQTAALAAAA
ncbi:MAG TPA: SpoIVB peptidase [Ruminococcus sp.]|nr:SpoIVB peptidase [Ruminococcus sp.]